jgi:phosphatidylserine/phosphatidylglycerophosphate/cardiolipin synthase-like enzyme
MAIANGTRDWVIIDELVRMIDNVPAGGSIKGAIASITLDNVAIALKAAKDRGVTVRLAVNGNMYTAADTAITDPAYGLRYGFTPAERKFCGYASGVNMSCNSNRVNAGAFAHTKLFTFSSTTSPDDPATQISNVVWVGSANLNYGSGTDTANNAIQYYGAPTAYNQMVAHLDAMYNEAPKTSDYTAAYYAGSAVFTAWGSPRVNDFVYDQLNLVASGTGCQVRVLQNTFEGRQSLADRLAYKKANGGCDIKVMVSKGYGAANGTAHISAAHLTTLKNAGIPVYVHHSIHDKVLMLNGTLSGTAGRSAVYTGSHNWSFGALRDNDEIFVKVPDTSTSVLYALFNAHFDQLLNDGNAYRL